MDLVKVGSIVTVYDFDLQEKIAYKIVKEIDTNNPKENEISQNSPMAKALLGGFAGIKEVISLDGKYRIKILKVDNTQGVVDENKLQAEELRKILKKVDKDRENKEEKRRKARNLDGYYQTHPFQGGGCSGK